MDLVDGMVELNFRAIARFDRLNIANDLRIAVCEAAPFDMVLAAKIGTVEEYPRLRDVENAVLALRAKINVETRSPETVNDLIAHYSKIELSEEGGKRTSTRQVYSGYLKVQIAPKWGGLRLNQVRTVAVEQWLRSLDYAPGTKSKIRNIMSAVFSHAKRYEMVRDNPIEGVRCSSKRMRVPDVLTPDEFKALLPELPQRERVMVMLAGTTGLRRSELIALTWQNIDFDGLLVDINKSCVRAQIGETKTAASAKPVRSSVLWRKSCWRGSESQGIPA